MTHSVKDRNVHVWASFSCSILHETLFKECIISNAVLLCLFLFFTHVFTFCMLFLKSLFMVSLYCSWLSVMCTEPYGMLAVCVLCLIPSFQSCETVICASADCTCSYVYNWKHHKKGEGESRNTGKQWQTFFKKGLTNVLPLHILIF